MQAVTPAVTLISFTPDPVRALYQSYRVCYSAESPQETLTKIWEGKISEDKMLKFIKERMKTGHTSPLEQVNFEFGISGVSRAFSHQFVRHRMMSVEQQSQRYVKENFETFEYVIPPSVTRVGGLAAADYSSAVASALDDYLCLVSDGVPPEDARFLFPNAAATNLKCTINLASFLHMADLRLCTRAQWEFRKVVSLMRAEVVKQIPWLKQYIQPKCGENRMGYCDEDYKAYCDCPLSAVRPWKGHEDRGFQPLEDVDYILIRDQGTVSPEKQPTRE